MNPLEVLYKINAGKNPLFYRTVLVIKTEILCLFSGFILNHLLMQCQFQEIKQLT